MHKHVYVVSPDYVDTYPIAAYTSFDMALCEVRDMARIAQAAYIIDALPVDTLAHNVVDRHGWKAEDCEVCTGPGTVVKHKEAE